MRGHLGGVDSEFPIDPDDIGNEFHRPTNNQFFYNRNTSLALFGIWIKGDSLASKEKLQTHGSYFRLVHRFGIDRTAWNINHASPGFDDVPDFLSRSQKVIPHVIVAQNGNP